MKRESNRDRPPPLRINKPAISNAQQNPRQPLIIHAVSPEVIQTDPRNFMSLVQKLTGQALVSPVIPTKKPRIGLGLGLGFPADQQQQQQQNSNNNSNNEAAGQPLTPNAYNLISQHQRSMMQLGLGFGQTLNSQQQQKDKLGLGLGLQNPDQQQEKQSNSFDFNVQESNQANTQSNEQLLSVTNFILSPQALPSPSKFFHDWQTLLSPAAASAMAAAKSPNVSSIAGTNNNSATTGSHSQHLPPPISPLSFPSPGPLTKVLNMEFPPFSPMAGLWSFDPLQKSPMGFSADTTSCIPASGYGYSLPPRPPA